MTNSESITCLPQEWETPTQVVRRAGFSYRYSYARSADGQVSGERGQDYLTIREDEQRLTFALCDGVSQSFFGDLAARWVGEALLTWLWEELPSDDHHEKLQVSLAHRLRALAATAQERVNTLPLPEGLAPMVRDVLEEKRALGSQSTFAGGMIDTAAKRLILVWMGDSRIRLWGPDGLEHTDELGDTFHTHERWSSHQGLVGEVHVFTAPLERVSRVAAYSDGLAQAADSLTTSPSHQALDALITDAGQSSTSDDVSFLELWLGPAPDLGPLPLSAPVRVDVTRMAEQLRTTWQQVPGAAHYQVEYQSSDGTRSWEVSQPEWALAEEHPSPEAGAVRVRAWRDDAPGQWSVPMPAAGQPSMQGAVETQPAMPPASRPVAASIAGPSTPLLLLSMVAVGGFVCIAVAAIVWRTPLGRGLLVAPTASPTSTVTPTIVSATPTSASPPTASLPLAPTATLESSPTSEPTWTATATPGPTTTPMLTWTPTPTPSPTATPTLTWTPTPTLTPTATSTLMPTPTPSPTVVQSRTLTPTVSSTPASSPEAEPTATLEMSWLTPEGPVVLSSTTVGPEAVAAGEDMWYTTPEV